MRPLRVLFVSGEFPPMQGGVGDYTALLLRALMKLGDTASVGPVLPRKDVRPGAGGEPLSHKLSHLHQHHGLTCDVVTTANRGVPATSTVFPIVPRWDLHDWPTLAGLIRARQPDILHIQYQTAAYGMRPLVNLLPLLLRATHSRVRVVTTYHDLRVPFLFPKAGPVRGWANWLLAAGSHALIATNDEDLVRLSGQGRSKTSYANDHAPGSVRLGRARDSRGRDARAPRHPASSSRTVLIPIGSNIPVSPPRAYAREAWRARLGVKEDQSLLSFFGLLNHSKGLDTLFSAISGLPPEYPVRLIMIGGTAGDSDRTNIEYRQRMLDLCHTLGLDERVIWTGYTNPAEVSGHLLASDIGVLPFRDGASFRRGSLLAALSHSLPVVTTTHRTGHPLGAGPAQLRHQENCLLVSPDDPEATRAAIVRLSESRDLRHKLSRGASALAQSLTWEKIAAETIKLYESLAISDQ
ncbi:MAG: glycosyltransferase [Chloroflexota bacterium]|nr:MAG: glycosyltransferase [Chloroflexota bacterium]